VGKIYHPFYRCQVERKRCRICAMKPNILPLFFSALLTCFALSPSVQALNPPPDGGYPRGNTAEGEEALNNLSLGQRNTAIGFRALFINTVGGWNTGIGALALQHNITGNYNTATGVRALEENTIGISNTATGFRALDDNTTGNSNTAIGSTALLFNSTGNNNTATGEAALHDTTTGNSNTATGTAALRNNTTGSHNTATGLLALGSNTTGDANCAIGSGALFNNTAGDSNIALGVGAGSGVVNADDVICIGRGVAGVNVSNSCFIGNIRGVTTNNSNALPVVIDGAGQLGTISSSQRFKHDIKPMDKASEALLALEPVTFHYKSDSANIAQFGLIAEEVEKVNPDLVVRDERGEIYTVRYDAVNAMLLNEFLKEHREVQELKKQVAALTAGLQKVGAQLAMGRKSVPGGLEINGAATEVVNNP